MEETEGEGREVEGSKDGVQGEMEETKEGDQPEPYAVYGKVFLYVIY